MGVGIRSGLYDLGMPPPWQIGRYYYTPWSAGALGGSSALGVGTLRCAPFDVPNSVQITRVGAEVLSAGDVGSKLRFGIYADDGTGRPGALLLDAGTINGDSATLQEITGLNLTLGPGRYWVACAVQSVATTQPQVRTLSSIPIPVDTSTAGTGNSSGTGYSQGDVTGALPSTFSGTAISGVHPRMFVRT